MAVTVALAVMGVMDVMVLAFAMVVTVGVAATVA